jgi:hypothetical protein
MKAASVMTQHADSLGADTHVNTEDFISVLIPGEL